MAVLQRTYRVRLVLDLRRSLAGLAGEAGYVAVEVLCIVDLEYNVS